MMSKPSSLDDRITRLVPEIDPSIRAELQQVLQTLRRADYPVGVIQMMSRLALRLFRLIYQAAGHSPPSDNLYDVIIHAGNGDAEKGVKGHGILPDALDSPLHTLRVLSNKIDHGVEKFQMGVEEAEFVLNAFLSVLKWFHCESGLIPTLPSIYASVAGTQGHAADAAPRDDSTGDVAFTLHIDREFASFSDIDQEEILAALRSLLKISRKVTVVGTRACSVLLTIRLRPSEAEQLLAAITGGALREYGVLSGVIEELALSAPAATSGVVETPAEQAVIPETTVEGRRQQPRTSERHRDSGDEGSVSRWISRAAQGEQEAAEKLWERYHDSLVRKARAMLHKTRPAPTDEQDAAQSAFASFFMGARAGRFPNLASRDELWRLLLVITYRKIASQVAHQFSAKRDVKQIARGNELEGLAAEPPPEFAAMLQEEWDRLVNKLADPRLREVASLILDGRTDAEIAERMGIARRTVARKRNLIRSLWSKESHE
jgi:DNA-directed RNA polymerase specialized sigma24 family protein